MSQSTMRRIATLLFIFTLFLAWFLLDLLADAGYFKQLEPHGSEDCVRIRGPLGAEDITVHAELRVAWVSSQDRRHPSEPGHLYLARLDTAIPALEDLTPDLEFEFHPHGLSLSPSEVGGRLMVVNHRDETHTIEWFDWQHDQLNHVATIEDPLLSSPNDVVACAVDRFYVTNDHGNRSPSGRLLEDYLRLPRANILYFDGHSLREVADGICYANGINVSLDGSRVYAASSTTGKLLVYHREENGDLTLERTVETYTGLDNIELDPDGNLWIGAHPKLLAFVAHSKDAEKIAPSQVLRVTLNEDDATMVEFLLDEGTDLSGSSVAARFQQRLLVGSVFDDGFLICPLEQDKARAYP